MAINIYKEKNLGAENIKNEKYFILILDFFTRKIGIGKQEKARKQRVFVLLKRYTFAILVILSFWFLLGKM